MHILHIAQQISSMARVKGNGYLPDKRICTKYLVGFTLPRKSVVNCLDHLGMATAVDCQMCCSWLTKAEYSLHRDKHNKII